MAFHNELGKKGEELAVGLLRSKGYHILDRNWKYGNFEIDIIACTKDQIVFVEVKTRSDDYWMRPEDAVTLRKQSNTTIAASHYMQLRHIALEPRFDVIAIILNDHNQEVNHIEDAFVPVILPRKRR